MTRRDRAASSSGEGLSPGEGHRILILDYSVDRSEAPLFSRWLPEGSEREVSFVHFGDPIPSPVGFTRVMHTGSSLSICEDAVFTQDACEVVRECVAKGVPQMGVCYGHQLLCRALLGPCCPAVGWDGGTGSPAPLRRCMGVCLHNKMGAFFLGCNTGGNAPGANVGAEIMVKSHTSSCAVSKMVHSLAALL